MIPICGLCLKAAGTVALSRLDVPDECAACGAAAAPFVSTPDVALRALYEYTLRLAAAIEKASA